MLNQYKMPKLKFYSVTDVLAVIVSIKHGQSQTNMSHDNGAPESTIHGQFKGEEKFFDILDVVDSIDRLKRKKPELQRIVPENIYTPS